jgi:putative transposase
MGQYFKASHCVYDCRYHIVWIIKYRRKCLDEKMRAKLAAVLSGVCAELSVRIVRMGMEEDHVHMYVSVPPVQPIPYVVQILKGRSAKVIRQEFAKELRPHYWKPVLWAVGYFVATVGEVTHETVAKYVEEQGKKDIEDECSEATDF